MYLLGGCFVLPNIFPFLALFILHLIFPFSPRVTENIFQKNQSNEIREKKVIYREFLENNSLKRVLTFSIHILRIHTLILALKT